MYSFILFSDDSVFYESTTQVASNSTFIRAFLQVDVHGYLLIFYSLPVLVKDTGAPLETVKDNFSAAIAAEAARVKSAVALVDGSVVQNSNHSDTFAFRCIGSFY